MANRWSHANGKTLADLVPCSWQPTLFRGTAPAAATPGGRKLQDVVGELVQTTAGKPITHPPTRCPHGGV